MRHKRVGSQIEAPRVAVEPLQSEPNEATALVMQARRLGEGQWHTESFPTIGLGALDHVSGETDGCTEDAAIQLAVITAHGLRSLTEEQIGRVVQRTAYSREKLKKIVEALAETLESR